MSLFDNTKIPGWALFFAGILMIISALIGFYDAFAEHDGAGDITGYIIVAVGSLLAGLVYIAVSDGSRVVVTKNNFEGGRQQVRDSTVAEACGLLKDFIGGML